MWYRLNRERGGVMEVEGEEAGRRDKGELESKRQDQRTWTITKIMR